ncbi:thiamine-phosphate kinase [Parablastomonas sp. CN1-191]|uniref:thiamine-phosphate kinase n=1 Tax=Parablastomonas sp. CN1-191 TaxID=3400908 RepID=UPI003BF8833C
MSRESAFIEALRGIATQPAARGLNDDAAVLEFGGEALVLTHDAIALGTHFRADADPADLAWRLVATNLSDLAAKGAEPLGVLVGYQLGDDEARFAEGLAEALEHYDTPLLGGDTFAAAEGRVLGLTAIGRATHRPVPSRSGAKPGDTVWVTGKLGAALAAFEALDNPEATDADTLAYRRPVALIAEGRALAPHVTAMMDISDGLLLDASRLAKASDVTLSLASAAIPIALSVARRDEALRWGDDYQLLFTLTEGFGPPIAATRIGQTEPPGSANLLLDGRPARDPLGYEH